MLFFEKYQAMIESAQSPMVFLAGKRAEGETWRFEAEIDQEKRD